MLITGIHSIHKVTHLYYVVWGKVGSTVRNLSHVPRIILFKGISSDKLYLKCQFKFITGNVADPHRSGFELNQIKKTVKKIIILKNLLNSLKKFFIRTKFCIYRKTFTSLCNVLYKEFTGLKRKIKILFVC